MKKIKYTYAQFEQDIGKLAKKLAPYAKSIENIYGIPRGGLIPATYLSHRLGKPLITDYKKISNKTVIVDDIADTGNTLSKLISAVKYLKVVVLFSTPWTKYIPDEFCRMKRDGDWIIFPWETKSSSKYDNTA